MRCALLMMRHHSTSPLRIVLGRGEKRGAHGDGRKGSTQIVAEDADELIPKQVGLHDEASHRLRQ
jgi:hypothetical protein